MEQEQTYEQMISEALEKIKPVESKIDRFEVPKVQGHIEGNKTIITNFKQICSYIRREPDSIVKFLLKESASPGSIKGDRLVLTRKISSSIINDKIAIYVDTNVLCRECKKPDTEIIKEDRLNFIHCLACGAKHPVRSKI